MMKIAIALVVMLWIRRKVAQLWKFIGYARHKRALLQALPGPSCKEFGLLGTVTSLVPDGVELNDDNLRTYFIQSLEKAISTPEQKNEGLIRLWVLNENLPCSCVAKVFVYDIAVARQVLQSKTLDYYEKGNSYKISRPLIGDGVLSSSGPKWAHQRPFLEKGFKTDLLKRNMSRIVLTAKEHCDRVNNIIGTGTPINVVEEMLKVTLDVLGRVAFSHDIGSVTAPTTADAPLYHVFENIIKELENRCRNPLKNLARHLPLENNFIFDRDMKKLDLFVDALIDKRLSKDEEEKREMDLLDVMMAGLTEAEQVDGTSNLTRTEMKDNIKTMLFAGHDTTASALTWFLYLVAKNPQVADKIRQEAAEHLGDDICMPDIERLERMPYMNACVLEVLRLYPSAAFTRNVLTDVQVGKYLIPQNTEVFVYPYFIHRDPRNFENPNDFIPERWLLNKTGSENLTLQAQLALETKSHAYLPFSLGKRNCVGRPLALLEIRVIMLNILDKFNIKPTKKEYKEYPDMSLTLTPAGIELIYETR